MEPPKEDEPTDEAKPSGLRRLGVFIVAFILDWVNVGRIVDFYQEEKKGVKKGWVLFSATLIAAMSLEGLVIWWWLTIHIKPNSDFTPKYCLIDYSGNITEDHGVAELLHHGISMAYDNYGEPSEMYVMFTKYMIHAPVVTSVESRIFQVTPSKEDDANGFHLTFEAMQEIPRTPYPKDAPFCIKMEITN